ncbi:DUF3696 domain-containing protein [Shewanella sp. AS16]|uniref:DUF3696 domain-containing protein n=1 Tax=Shewanella sp. AS16 TaxID=2907625 RepID=UPI001F3556F5|nr:DUF3696 domain-containing protein [Shewanella sp. AS16]MCE9685465.1 DUF3696 domain-containing protein [Shewanella sp. AS16]
MFKEIKCKNYKAFESFSLELKPLTILLGANSFGKSSILNLLLMLTQSVNSNELSDSPLRINGSLVGFGEAENVIRKMNEDNILSISITSSDVVNNSIENVTQNHFDEFIYTTQRFFINDGELVDEYFVDADFENGLQGEFVNLSKYVIERIKGIRNNGKPSDGDKDGLTARYLNDYIYKSKFTKTMDFANAVESLFCKNINICKLEYEFRLSYKVNKLSLHSVSFYTGDDLLFIKIYDENGTYKLSSEIVDNSALNNSRKDIISGLNLNSMSFGGVGEYRFSRHSTLSKNIFSKFVCALIKSSSKEFLQVFNSDSVSHVSPLRAFPQRYYLLDKTILRTQINTSDGNELAEVLKKRMDILDKINILLAKFDLLIKVVNVNNIIHRIIVVQNNVDLEITDVGFGISQVLPILVQAYLSPRGSIVIMEQPEIHLHPNMQAWLADALINISIDEHKYFIIETHSESIIRRLRRRVAEANHPLSSDDVAIYNVQRNGADDSSELERVTINENGDIKWPKGFLDVEMDDMISIQQSKMNRMNNK